MFIAKKETAETVYWLKLIMDVGLINNQENIMKLTDLLDESNQILKIIGKITRNIK